MQTIKWVPTQTQPAPAPAPEPTKVIEKLEKKLIHYAGRAIMDYQMIKKGDRVLVCVSGGKDSITMLTVLEMLRKRAPLKFELLAFTLDQGQPGWDDNGLKAFYERHGHKYLIMNQDTYSIVKEKIPENQTYCSLCSRLRRGIIYRYARENGYNKVALGHHRDDLITSLLMSIFYNGEIRSMPPKLLSDSKESMIIRPLSYCQEKDIAQYAKLREFPIIPCNLCGSQENLARKKVKRWIEMISQDNPKIPSNMLSALQQVKPSQLMDKKLWDFIQLEDQQLEPAYNKENEYLKD